MSPILTNTLSICITLQQLPSQQRLQSPALPIQLHLHAYSIIALTTFFTLLGMLSAPAATAKSLFSSTNHPTAPATQAATPTPKDSTASERDEEDEHHRDTLKVGGVELEGYGIMNYYNYNWQTDPSRRAQIDIERAAIEPSYQLAKNIRLEAEVEFEHGGTGTTMEFDKFEESGEYEQEIEKGGEVVLEKFLVDFQIDPLFNVKVGHFYVPIGLTNSDYEPTDYFTTTRSEAEASLIPATWHATGVAVHGDADDLSYELQLVNGLDATGFSSANWIFYGAQGRFEMVNAENMALAARVDYHFEGKSMVGVSGYFGNSAGNRPKPDMTVPANVTIGEAHVVYEEGPVTVRAVGLYGHLQNAAAVSAANRNLSSALNVKRNAVASEALGWYAEAGYNVLTLFPSHTSHAKLDVFGRYDYYNSMYAVPDGIFANPRWERKQWTAGVNYRFATAPLVLKAQYCSRTLGLQTNNKENTISTGLGVEF